jgi:hypothetical protein
MIGKLPKKDIIALLYITILTVIALVYGFSTIPSPVAQREKSYDHQRVVHLGQLKYSIDEAYRKTYQLPNTLSEISENVYSPSMPLEKTDPETKAAYEYTKVSNSPPSFKLCATFTTDSMNEDPYAYDDANYNYSSFSNDFKHPKGHYCFTFTPNSYYPTPSPQVTTYPTTTTPPSRKPVLQ